MPAASEASIRKLLAAQLHLLNDDEDDADPDRLSGFWTPITSAATAEAEASTSFCGVNLPLARLLNAGRLIACG